MTTDPIKKKCIKIIHIIEETFFSYEKYNYDNINCFFPGWKRILWKRRPLIPGCDFFPIWTHKLWKEFLKNCVPYYYIQIYDNLSYQIGLPQKSLFIIRFVIAGRWFLSPFELKKWWYMRGEQNCIEIFAFSVWNVW